MFTEPLTRPKAHQVNFSATHQTTTIAIDGLGDIFLHLCAHEPCMSGRWVEVNVHTGDLAPEFVGPHGEPRILLSVNGIEMYRYRPGDREPGTDAYTDPRRDVLPAPGWLACTSAWGVGTVNVYLRPHDEGMGGRWVEVNVSTELLPSVFRAPNGEPRLECAVNDVDVCAYVPGWSFKEPRLLPETAGVVQENFWSLTDARNEAIEGELDEAAPDVDDETQTVQYTAFGVILGGGVLVLIWALVAGVFIL